MSKNFWLIPDNIYFLTHGSYGATPRIVLDYQQQLRERMEKQPLAFLGRELEGLYEHFLTIAKACPDLPVMLYNIPGRTGQNMTPETIIKLAAVDNIVAVKEASGNLEQTCKIYCHTPENFAIYSGDDFLTLPLMTCGAVGVVSVASHLVGEEIQGMIQAFLTGDAAKAIEINLKLFPLTLFTLMGMEIFVVLKVLNY